MVWNFTKPKLLEPKNYIGRKIVWHHPHGDFNETITEYVEDDIYCSPGLYRINGAAYYMNNCYARYDFIAMKKSESWGLVSFARNKPLIFNFEWDD